jgi:hypothetical protein
MGIVYITSGKGELQLEDGRTMVLNGIGNEAVLSDGSRILVGGVGPLFYPDIPLPSVTTASVNPPSGLETTISINVAPASGDQTALVPSGQVTVTVPGNSPFQLTLDGNGNASDLLSDFIDSGVNQILVQYPGDAHFGPSSTTVNFTYTPH